MFAWTMIFCGLFACDTGASACHLFNHKPQSLGLASHPKPPIVVFAKIVARRSGRAMTLSFERRLVGLSSTKSIVNCSWHSRPSSAPWKGRRRRASSANATQHKQSERQRRVSAQSPVMTAVDDVFTQDQIRQIHVRPTIEQARRKYSTAEIVNAPDSLC
jgi:hypothetical protein